MSLYSRARKKRIRDFKRIYLKDSFQVRNWFFWQVHEVPNKITYGAQFDFWGYNGQDIFLITLENTEKYIKEIATSPNEPLRVFVGMPINKNQKNKLEDLVTAINGSSIQKKKKKR
jgi:hypothetical protein